jgi:hypothetical protein
LKDFEESPSLRQESLDLVHKIIEDKRITQTELNVAQTIIQQLDTDFYKRINSKIDLQSLLAGPKVPKSIKFEELSVSEIAEQMTYLDYQIFYSITSK